MFNKFSFSPFIVNIFKSTSSMTASVMLARIIELVSLFYVARFLSKESYGELGILKNFAQTLVLFSVGALQSSLVKYVAKSKSLNKNLDAKNFIDLIFTLSCLSAVLIIIVLFIFSDSISKFYLNKAELSSFLLLISILCLFNIMNGLFKSILSSIEKFNELSKITALAGFLNGFAYVLGVNLASIEGVIFGLLLVSIISSFLYYIKIDNNHKPTFNFKFNDNLKKFLKNYTFPSFLVGLIINFTVWICNLSLLQSLDGYSQYAIFSTTLTLSSVTIMIHQASGRILFPIIMKEGNQINKKLREKLNFGFSSIIGFIINTPLILFPEILGIVFGIKYGDNLSQITLIVVANYTIIISFREGIQRNLAREEKQWLNVASNLVWGLIAIITISLFQNLSAVERAISFLVAYFAQIVIFYPIFLKQNIIPRFSKIEYTIIFIFISLWFTFNLLWFLDFSLTFRFVTLVLILAIVFHKFYGYVKA